MSVHIGDINSQVTVAGAPGTAPVSAPGGDQRQQPWDLLERHRRLTEKDKDDRRRTAGDGFDG
jgi:hypothetical protein